MLPLQLCFGFSSLTPPHIHFYQALSSPRFSSPPLPLFKRKKGDFSPPKQKRVLWLTLAVAFQVIATFNFHNQATIYDNLGTVVNTVRAEIRLAEDFHLQRTGVAVAALEHFDAWLADHFDKMKENTKEWVLEQCGHLELVVGTNNAQQRAVIPQFRNAVNNNMAIDQRNFYDN